MNKKPLLLGAHISVAGGFDKAIIRGESIGCTAIQIFTKSNRQWFAKPITDHESKLFKETWRNSIIQNIIAHSSYLINVGAASDELRKKSIDSLAQELQRCAQLSIEYLVIHPGSCGPLSENECLARITDGIDQALNQAQGNTKILLETMAGQGTNLCYKLEHIAYIKNSSRYPDRLGVCFDTCHAFAAGYDFRNEALYEKLWQNFDEIIGLDQLKAIHVNDSKKELGSRVDRHENVAQGELGQEPFRLLFNDERFFNIPKILETPKDSLLEDFINMQRICGLLNKETSEKLQIRVPQEFRGSEK